MMENKAIHVSQCTYLINFKSHENKIRLMQREAENAYGMLGIGQSSQTNMPDQAPPNLPRIVFASKNENISISQQATQYSANFEDGVVQETTIKGIKQRCRDFFNATPKMTPKENLSTSALLLTFNIKSNISSNNLNEILFDKFIRLPKIANLASTQFTIGFKMDDLFVNIKSSTYEKRQLVIPIGGPAMLHPSMISPEQSPIVEKGIQLVLDINDRPRFQAPAVAPNTIDPSKLIDSAEKVMEDHLNKILLSINQAIESN